MFQRCANKSAGSQASTTAGSYLTKRSKSPSLSMLHERNKGSIQAGWEGSALYQDGILLLGSVRGRVDRAQRVRECGRQVRALGFDEPRAIHRQRPCTSQAKQAHKRQAHYCPWGRFESNRHVILAVIKIKSYYSNATD